jgi:ferrochelatase
VTTSGSCLNYFRAVAGKTGLAAKTEILPVGAWFQEPLYLEAMADAIKGAQNQFSLQDPSAIQLLYSAHSIPARYVAEGDPYQEQTEATVTAINELLGGAFPSLLAYQSKLGPVRWLGPATAELLAGLGRKGERRVLMVPVSFVSDHIETLQEIDILYQGLAAKAGIREFHRAPSMNLTAKFIEALANICIQRTAT